MDVDVGKHEFGGEVVLILVVWYQRAGKISGPLSAVWRAGRQISWGWADVDG